VADPIRDGRDGGHGGDGEDGGGRGPAVLDVVALIWERDGQLLAARTHGRDAWYLPGGKREPGEAPADALVREVREELGVALDAATVEPVVTVEAVAHGWPAGTRVRMSCWRGEVAGEPRPCGEIAELAWLGPEALAGLAPAAQLAFRAVFGGPGDRAGPAPGAERLDRER
jgi:8-oxo-dGTP pyrophosphatase MutT (NUDIX family)